MFLMSCYMVSSTNTVAYLSMLSRPVMEFQNTARGHWNLYLLPVSEYFMHTVCLSFFGTTITCDLKFSLQNRRCENIPVYGVIMTHVRIMRWREESLEQWHSAAAMILNFGAAQVGELSRGLGTLTRRKLELETNLCEDQSFTITKNAPSRAFSWFKVPKDVMGCNGMLTQRS